jgi:MoxR-like ATPase
LSDTHYPALSDIDAIQQAFESAGYICTTRIATVVRLAAALEKPVLIEGPPGVGKTELAKTCAMVVDRPLVRLQCYEGLDASSALYEWNYPKQLLYIRLKEKAESQEDNIEKAIFSKDFLIKRPLLEAIQYSQEKAPVLLIDEIDKAELEFPNDLLHELDQMSFYIPETREWIKGKHRPIVVITSNSEKELPEAFLRRCIFHYIEFPDPEMMKKIVEVHYPGLSEKLINTAVKRFYEIRNLRELRKKPSTSELLDWIRVLMTERISEKEIENNLPFLGVLLKKTKDVEIARRRLAGV